ncbi:MAG: hypothetical protein K2K00_04765, partial [Muribaculaceae bacterium]|nr:hypothetical protein [Muribaculaceae bacterium]
MILCKDTKKINNSAPAPISAKIATAATHTASVGLLPGAAARRRSRETIIATCKRGRAVRSLW